MSVRLLGAGRLHDAIARRGVTSDDAAAGDVVVTAADTWDPDEELDRQRRLREHGVPVLHCRLDGNLGFVGPWVRPGRAGCVACAEVRRRVAAGLGDTADVVTPRRTPPVGTPAWVDLLACAAVAAARQPADDRIYVLRADDLRGYRHRYLPVPSCPHCGTLPDDTPRTGPPRTAIPADGTSFRGSGPAPDRHALRAAVADWRYGIVTRTYRSASAPLPLTIAEAPVMGRSVDAGGYGRAATFDEAETVALLEAMERYAGIAPLARRTAVTATYREVAPDAVDPARLGLPDLDETSAAGRTGYHPDLRMSWVWAWSLTTRRAVLVPECVAYWGGTSPWLPRPPRYCVDTSNGCALGRSVEEAVLHGMFEIAERDGFLLAWHRASEVPEIDVASVADDLTTDLAGRASCAGYDLRLFDVTTDLDVPAVWAFLGRRDGGVPVAFNAAGASPDPVRAVRAAVVEVVVDLYDRFDPARRPPPDVLDRLVADDHAVRTLDDHIDVYTHPDALPRLDFLLRPRPRAALAEVYAGHPARWQRTDLGDTLADLVAHWATAGVDVVVVDQTGPEHERAGLRSVKVIAPGTVPMTFGHAHRRLRGIARLLHGARGRDERSLRYADLNHRPHPFP
jgi:bacteriocin biosynthesis cyclodehydratase domain-containing protein